MKKQSIRNILFFISIAIVIYGWSVHKNNHTHSHNGFEHSHNDEHNKIAKDYFSDYEIINKDFGTKTIVTVNKTTRKMVTNALPDHKTGTYPRKGNPNTISAQQKTYNFPVSPKYIGKPTWVREPGVAINGVKFEPGTAEVVVCETGENYRVEAFQDLIDLGLDFNHAHVQPTGAYHYHGSPTSVIEHSNTEEDLVHLGFAHDGFPMYYSKSNAYKPSYKLIDGTREGEDCTYSNPKKTIKVNVNDNHDGTFGSDYSYVEGSGDLDECNGITVNGEYIYLVTDDFPYVSRCLMGEYEEQRLERRRPEGMRPMGFEALLKAMDGNKDNKLSKNEVKGPLGRDFDKIDANKDGFITQEELENNRPKKRRN